MRIRQSVVKVEYLSNRYNRRGEGLCNLILSCGHLNSRKASKPIPKKAICVYCERESLRK